MYDRSVIENPFGISVFCSHILRVEPDVVSLRFSVSRLKQEPQDAFRETRAAVHRVRAYLQQAQVADVGTSQIMLSQSTRFKTGGEREHLGYTANVSFQVLLHDLGQVEDILVGVIDAGVDQIQRVEFQTSRLKEYRAQARTQAVEAAREKAEVYCRAAGVALGPVLHIQDINPTSPEDMTRGHNAPAEPEFDGPPSAFNPGSIVVTGSVVIGYALLKP